MRYLIFIACLCAIGCSQADTDSAPATTSATAPSANNAEHLAIHLSRTDLTLEDFRALRHDMSLQEVQERLGPPRRDIGSGIYILEYELVDGETVRIGSSGPKLLYVVYQDGYLPLGDN